MATVEEVMQIELKKQPANFQAQDKRLQELRAFALEYVKLIVLKASELSQQQQHHQQQQQQQQLQGKSSLICEKQRNYIASAANKINENFRLPSFNEQEQRIHLAASTNTSFLSKQVQVNQPKSVLKSSPKIYNNNNNSIVSNDYSPSAATGRGDLLRRIEDYEEDYEELGEFERSIRYDEGSGSKQQKEKMFNPTNNQYSSGGLGHQRQKLYQRLNWHLFVSCFSNCLPHTLVERGSSGSSQPNRDSFGGSSV